MTGSPLWDGYPQSAAAEWEPKNCIFGDALWKAKTEKISDVDYVREKHRETVMTNIREIISISSAREE